MYTISVADAEKFLTTSYMPVKTVSLAYANDAAAESALTESDYAQYLNQKASRDHAQAAGIERLEMTANGNSNYSSKPTVTITGDGTGATTVAADITMSGSGSTQNVASITMAQARKGTDYTVAEVTISGGGGTLATARAVISPQTGHGVDPVQELGGFYAALNTLLTGTEAGDLVVAQDFRQVSLIKKPLNYGTTTISTATTLRALKYLDLTGSNPTANFVLDAIVTGAGGAKAFITEIDVTNGRLYFHQNSKTGYKAFVNGEAITGVGGGSATLAGTAVVNGEVAYNSGQMIFLENRSPINRSSNQTEDIKVIIEF